MHDEFETTPSLESELQPRGEAIPALMRFARVMVQRRRLVMAVCAVFCACGVAYYLLAPRQYQSTAKLLIVQQKQDQLATVGDHDSSDNTMATQRELVRSPIVLQRAIEQLGDAQRIDLLDEPADRWTETLGERLQTATTRKTNFIDVSYRSLDPDAAAAVVRAVIDSYLAFVKETHSGTAGELIDVLTRERLRIQDNLETKQRELQEFRERIGHLAVSSEDRVVEPLIQRAISYNEALLEAQQRRLEVQSAAAAATAAMQNGEDVLQHLGSLEESVGRELLLSSLGMSERDMKLTANQEERLLKAQDELRNVSAFYGPNHPRVLELQQQIAALDHYLATYQARAGSRSNTSIDPAAAETIQRTLTQALHNAEQREQQLAEAYELARAEASRHSGDLVEIQMRERELERLESWHDMLFEKIAAVDIRQIQAPIQATVVREPESDPKPVSPQLRFVGLVSLLGGALLGTLIVYVQDVLDDRFNSPEELSSQLKAPVLAIVRNLRSLEGHGLQKVHAHAIPMDPESEA
ncbi:MAG: hypothetical protein KDA61_08160, partial [Planctomycetales bacterium]|nr:hypothetical protein [Planctomycetales bacterium]